jgi:hypothetical protein
MTTPEEAARRIMERDAPAFLVEGKLGSDAVTVARALLAAEARIRELENIVKHMLGAIEGGTIDSEEIAGDYESGISPHKWHDQWSYYARRALAKPEETST